MTAKPKPESKPEAFHESVDPDEVESKDADVIYQGFHLFIKELSSHSTKRPYKCALALTAVVMVCKGNRSMARKLLLSVPNQEIEPFPLARTN